MTFLPIVDRELRVAARLPATYRNRSLTAGAVAAVAVLMMLFDALSTSPAMMGAIMFTILSYLAVVFCLLEGVRKTADCLSEEKREGTLGLLFLTDLKGYDIVLGKLAGMSLNSIYGLVSILPVLALPLLLGGVMPGEFWRMVLALLNILFFSLSAGICISAISRQEQSAMSGAFLVTTGIAAIPLLVPGFSYPQLSPLYGFHTAFEAYYRADARGYWEALGLTQLWSWLLLLAACWLVPRLWQHKEGRKNVEPWYQRDWLRPRREAAAKRAQVRTQQLEINPFLWLASRQRTGWLELRIYVGIALIGLIFLVVIGNPDFAGPFLAGACILNLVLKMRVAAQACHCLAEARRNNALEMLLVTPLTSNQIIAGQILALRRTFVGPGLAILCLEVLGLFVGFALNNAERRTDFWDPIGILLIAGYPFTFALDVVAVTWVGMWFGLTAKKESQAVSKTILYVLVAPIFTLLFACFGLPFFFLIPLFWIGWAKARLETRMRELAGQRYALNPVGLRHWTPSNLTSKPPPIPGQ